MHDRVQQCRRHLALFFNRRNDGAATVFEFAQITQPFFKQAQLDIIEAAGGFLAVTRNERHARAFIKQGNGSGNLNRFCGKFDG